MLKISPCRLCAIWILGTGLAVANPAVGDDDGQEIDEILVTAESIEETIPLELQKYGNRLHILSDDEIELGGFDDLSQTLQMTVPGLYVAPKNGPYDYMNCSLQGSRCEDVLWLIDGVRINNRLYNTTSPLDTVPAHIVERVEVLYGGQGIFYGTQSTAGVINVVTRGFSDEPTGSVEVGMDEFDGYHLNGDYRTSFGENQLVLYGSKDDSDGFSPFGREDYQPSATDRERGYDVLTLGARYARNFGANSRLTFLYQKTRNEIDNLVPYRVAVRNNARDEDLVTAKWDQVVTDSIDLYIKAYYHDWDTEWDDIVNELDSSGQLTGSQTVLFQDTFWGFEDHGLTASARIRTDHGFEYAVGYDYQRFRGSDDVWLIENKTETAQAVYGQVRTSDRLLPDTHLALGVRYNSTDGANATVWNLSGQHGFGENLYLRATLGTSFRLPDAEELFLRDCCEVGNPDLTAEESENVEVALGGIVQVAGGLSWELIGYSRRVDNLIGIDFDNPAFPDGRFENFDTAADFSGWEISLALALNDSFDLSLAYIDAKAELAGTDEQLQDIPETLAKIGLNYRTEQMPLEVNLAILTVGDVSDVVGSGIGRIEHGGYTVVDVAAAYYLDSDRSHRIGLRLENAFDETYASSLGRGLRDSDASPYAYGNLGMPRTLHASYQYSF
ncbi:MAG: TonB-dependent receptor [Woeseia sp.]